MSRIALSLTVLSTVLLASACGSDGSSFGGGIPPATFVVTNPGTGDTNDLPLDPLVTGTRTGLRTVVGPTANGLIEVAYTLAEVSAEAGERFLRHHSYYRRGEHGIEYLGTTGALVGRSASRSVQPILVVPNVVREGMTWTTGNFEVTGEPITLSVTGRSEEETPFGLGVVWTIEFESDVQSSFADPMRFLEGYGMLADFGDPLRRRQPPFESFILPQVEPATEGDVRTVTSRAVSVPSAGAGFEDNFRVEGVTALERPDGRRLVALVGVQTGLVAQLPAEVDAAFCLEYETGSFTSGGRVDLTRLPDFPYTELSTPAYDGTPCNGLFDLSAVVERPSDSVQLTIPRLGAGTVGAFRNSNGSLYFPSLFLAREDDDPWVLVGNAESFLLHGPEDGASGVQNGGFFPLGTAVPADWGLLTVFDFDRTTGPGRRDGYYFAPALANLSHDDDVFYHLTPRGLLARSSVNMSGVGRFEPLFATLDDVTVQTTEAGAQRVLLTTPDGIVRRVVLDRGAEHLETLGRVALVAGEQLRAAIEVGDTGEVLVFTNDFSGPVLLGGNDCTGCTRVPYQPARLRVRLVEFGSPASPYAPPPALSVTARNTGTDVVVCWGPTDTPLNPSGWSLGGKPVTAIALADAPCAIAIRNPSTTTAELALPGAYALEANVPDVGMVRIALPERDAPQLGGPASMLGDLAITPQLQVWHVAGFSFGVAPAAFVTASLLDDTSGAWLRDQYGTLIHRRETNTVLTPVGDFPAGSYFDLAAPVLGGGAVVSARPLESAAFAGPAYLLSPDGTATRLADSTPTNRQVWLANGRSCAVGVAITCFAPNALTPDMTITVAGVSFAQSQLRSLDTTTAVAIAGGDAYRVDLAAGTATLIPANITGLIQPNLTRGPGGSLWAAVWAAPEETSPPPVRIARVRPDGVDIYEVEAPTYMESPESVTSVYPGESLFAVTAGPYTIRFAPPAD